jgi:hypothetical protein
MARTASPLSFLPRLPHGGQQRRHRAPHGGNLAGARPTHDPAPQTHEQPILHHASDTVKPIRVPLPDRVASVLLPTLSCGTTRDGNGYPLPETWWVFALLGYGFGSISLPMDLLMGSNGNPMGT